MKPLYEQIYKSLREDIISAKYQIGDQIPAEKELSKQFNVSNITIKKALEKLSSEGLIYRTRGKGTFVSNQKNENLTTKNNQGTKKPLFGLIVTTFDDSFGNRLIGGIEDAAQDTCHIILKRSLSIPEREDKAIRELLDYGIDGLIISPAKAEHYSREILKMIVDRFPFVLIDRSFKGLAATSVSTDNEKAAKEGIRHLIDLGHEHIGVLIPKDNSTTAIEDRIKGVVEAIVEKKVVVNRELWCAEIKSPYPTHKDTAKDIETIKAHLLKYPQITALFALEYNIAVLAKQAVEQLNLRIPEDISIMSFDSPPRNALEWNFTHLHQQEEKIGQQALDSLLDMYHGNFEMKKDIRIPAQLVEGTTTKNRGT
ncbi:GntR family transcriptional regulator [Gracilibacillus alcaliphilus]|uniref:GntR family transcriptional regulator n=1 Tax=Gracilibacillus alcaliphilus TaxID=1401441 RepID=UPI0019561C8D|nr:GntR family transcriptional regulator [Gracilibacillus alcaliphilus]MBM7677580.1 DNA-binding LacI/PurR family transcriptional regulator [Gracilibacillus alcaliphilus]